MKGNEDDMMVEESGHHSSGSPGGVSGINQTNGTTSVNDIDYDEMPPLSPNIVNEDELEDQDRRQQEQQQQNQSQKLHSYGAYRIQGDVSFQNRVSSIFDLLPRTSGTPHYQPESSAATNTNNTPTRKWTHYSLEDVGADETMFDAERENRMALADALRLVSEAHNSRKQGDNDGEETMDGGASSEEKENDTTSTFRPVYQQQQRHYYHQKPSAKRKMNLLQLEDYEQEGDGGGDGMDLETHHNEAMSNINENRSTTSTTSTASLSSVLPKHLMADGDEEQQQQSTAGFVSRDGSNAERKPTRRYRTRCSDE